MVGKGLSIDTSVSAVLENSGVHWDRSKAESAYRDLDTTSAHGIAYVRDNFCFPVAGGSFEDGMGA